MNIPAEAPLRAATYLGDNTLPIMSDLVDYLSEVTGIDLVVDRTAGRSSDEARHQAPALDMAWMCGYLAVSLISSGAISHGIVATPIFAGSGRPVYHAVIVTHVAGPASLQASLGTRLAISELESWSSYLGLKSHIENTLPGSWFADQRVTGSHRASIGAVAERSCDVASIDITVWNHVVATEPGVVADLRAIGRTPDWPAPPLTMRANLDPGRRDSLRAALHAIGPSDIPSLDGVVPAGFDIYEGTMSVRPPEG